ncbi:MAG: hypothetical protein OXI79_15015 [Gammaproteobacteria bacterium]|nr:hypothetical protein [Gammaproteobacteria bacterium]
MGGKQPFLTALGTGVLAILLSRWLVSGLAGAVVAVVAAIAAITVLGIYYWKQADVDSNQAGDDLYYLGLLFTLVSLSIALWQLFVWNPSEELEARTHGLIGNFGIALFSTVAGIVGRILLQDRSKDPAREAELDERPPTGPEAPVHGAGLGDQALHAEFAESMRALRDELREARNAFSHFTRMTLTQADQTKTHTEVLSQEFNERLEKVGQARLRSTAAAWRELESTAREQAQAGLSATAAAWQETAENVGSQAAKVVERFDHAVGDATNRAETAWRGLADDAQAAAESTREDVQRTAAAVAAIVHQLAAINEGLSSFAGNLALAHGRVQALGDTATSIAGDLDSRVAGIVEGHRALAENVRKYQEDGLDALRRSIDDFAETARELEAVGKALPTAIEQLNLAIVRQQDAADRNTETTNALTELAAREVQSWTDEAAPLRDALGDAVEAVKELAANVPEVSVVQGSAASGGDGAVRETATGVSDDLASPTEADDRPTGSWRRRRSASMQEPESPMSGGTGSVR